MGKLSKRQLAVIDDLFSGDDEQTVLARHRISRQIYIKWQANGDFTAEFDRRIATLNRQSELIIARYTVLATAKLVQLTESEKEETARKACLDVISLPRSVGQKTAETADNPQDNNNVELSQETASKLLAVLAEEK